MEAKCYQAMEHLKAGDKYLKTSFLKWKPDYDSAIAEYGKAATLFKNAKENSQAAETLLKLAELQKRNNNHFHAGKSLESAALIYKELKDLRKTADLIQQACDLYLEYGSPDTAGLALDRVAKIVAEDIPEKAVQLYLRACDVAEGEEKIRNCAEYVGKANRLLLKMRKLPEAADTLKREIGYFNTGDNHGVVNKLMMGLVMIYLHQGDSVAAMNEFQKGLHEYDGFVVSEEARLIQKLISAYEDGDQETVTLVATNPAFRYMENEFTKLARDLKVEQIHSVKRPAPSCSQNAAPSLEMGDSNVRNAEETVTEPAPALEQNAEEEEEEEDLK